MHATNEMIAAMRKTPLFSSLTDGSIGEFISQGRVVPFKAQRQVFSPGRPADQFYVVLSGQVKIYKLSSRGDEQTLHIYGPGDTFGEAAMLMRIDFPAFCRTLADTALLVVSRETMRRAIAKSPDMAMGMLAGLSSKLREFNSLIEQLSLKEVPARLATAILAQANAAGKNSFKLSQTKRELAARIGTVPETLSRTLAKMRRKGMIKVQGSNISIIDRPSLEDLAYKG